MKKFLFSLFGVIVCSTSLHATDRVVLGEFPAMPVNKGYAGWEKAATPGPDGLVISGGAKGGLIFESWRKPFNLAMLADGTLELKLTVLPGNTAEFLSVQLMAKEGGKLSFRFPLEGVEPGKPTTVRAENSKPLNAPSGDGAEVPLGTINMFHIQGPFKGQSKVNVSVQELTAVPYSADMDADRKKFEAAEQKRQERAAKAEAKKEEAAQQQAEKLANSKSNFVDLAPVTDQILEVHFDDGWVEHEPEVISGRKLSDPSRVHQSFLNIPKAETAETWKISSSDDPDYASPVTPVKVGRKSKGMDFLSKHRLDMFTEVVRDHWLYLQLPTPLKPGKTYTIQLDELARNAASHTFTFDPMSNRSPTVRANQQGYKPTAPSKYAYISQYMGSLGRLDLDSYADAKFHLVDVATGKSVFSGPIKLRKDFETGGPDSGRADNEDGPNNNWTGADLWEADFSVFNTPGEYVVAVERIGTSYPFRIDEHAYREAYYTAARGLYHNRAGTELKKEHTRWFRPRNLHHEDGWTGLLPDGSRYTGWGWYQDAGDWDPYPTHSRVATELLFAYELAPENFSDNELNIPESGNGLPDVLDSAAWQVNFMRRSIGPEGGVIARADFGEKKEGPAQPSWKDTRKWKVLNENAENSFRFAAIAAQLAYCIDIASDGKNPESAALIADAEKQFNWAVARMNEEAARLPELRKKAASLGREDRDLNQIMRGIAALNDHKAYAAAALYKATGNDKYQVLFKSLNRITGPDTLLRVSGGRDTKPEDRWDLRNAIWTYVTIPADDPKYANLDRALQDTLKQAALKWADVELIETAAKRGPRVGLEWTMPHVNGQGTTPDVMSAIVAHSVSKDPKYLEVIHNTVDYFMGGNPSDMLWMTGLGHQNPQQLLYLDQHFDEVDEIPPGFSPYGPKREGDRDDNWFDGPWDNDCQRNSAFPPHNQWPIHELWFENQYNPQGNEFTVHQNSAPWIAATGYLAGPPKGFKPNEAPTVKFASGETLTAKVGQPVVLKVTASDPDGRVRMIRFFEAKAPIGTATAEPFQVSWTPSELGTYTLTAAAVDEEGATTLSIDRPTMTVTVQ